MEGAEPGNTLVVRIESIEPTRDFALNVLIPYFGGLTSTNFTRTAAGPAERLDTYTTLFTNALDLAVIVPLVSLAGVLVLRRAVRGYLIAVPLLVLEAFLAPMITAQTVSQLQAGVTFPPGQIVGPIGGFATIAVVAILVIVALLRNISDPATSGTARVS